MNTFVKFPELPELFVRYGMDKKDSFFITLHNYPTSWATKMPRTIYQVLQEKLGKEWIVELESNGIGINCKPPEKRTEWESRKLLTPALIVAALTLKCDCNVINY